MNIGGKYWLVVFIHNNQVVHKEWITSYFGDEASVRKEAEDKAKQKGIVFTSTDATQTHEEQF